MSLTPKQIRKNLLKVIFFYCLPRMRILAMFLESILHFVPIIPITGSYWDEILKQNKVGLSTTKSVTDIVSKIKQLDNLYAKLDLNEFKNVQKIHDTKMISYKFIKTFHANS